MYEIQLIKVTTEVAGAFLVSDEQKNVCISPSLV